jgi:very-short-patch-repair endonuclease
MANDRARDARRHPTAAEAVLWKLLRNRHLEGQKFRGQHPVGPFIADFACLELRLLVEADGGQHAASTVDARRTAWLEAAGWRVVRFWNREILCGLAAVRERLVEEIAMCRRRHPHPPR